MTVHTFQCNISQHESATRSTRRKADYYFSLKVYDCFLENMQTMRNSTLTAVQQQ